MMALFHLYSTVFCVSYMLTIASALNFDKATKEELVVVRKVDVLLNGLLRNILDYIRGKKDSSLDWAYDAQNGTDFHGDVSFDNNFTDVKGNRTMPLDDNDFNSVEKERIPLNLSHTDGAILPPIVLPIDDGINAVPHSSNSKSGYNVTIVFPSIDVTEKTNQQNSMFHDQGIKHASQIPFVHGDRFPKWLGSPQVARKLYVMAEEAKMARERATDQLGARL